MIHKPKHSSKTRVYASIIGLVLVANILLSALVVFANYPTEAHRATARKLDVFSASMFNGGDFATIMDSEEYKKAAESPEASYTNTATIYTLIFNMIASVGLIGMVYYYLRKHRITPKPVGMTVLLVSIGGLLPLILTQFGSALYLGTHMPGIGSVAFMLFIGMVVAPLVTLLITRIIDWYYTSKYSFVID